MQSLDNECVFFFHLLIFRSFYEVMHFLCGSKWVGVEVFQAEDVNYGETVGNPCLK